MRVDASALPITVMDPASAQSIANNYNNAADLANIPNFNLQAFVAH